MKLFLGSVVYQASIPLLVHFNSILMSQLYLLLELCTADAVDNHVLQCFSSLARYVHIPVWSVIYDYTATVEAVYPSKLPLPMLPCTKSATVTFQLLSYMSVTTLNRCQCRPTYQ